MQQGKSSTTKSYRWRANAERLFTAATAGTHPIEASRQRSRPTLRPPSWVSPSPTPTLAWRRRAPCPNSDPPVISNLWPPHNPPPPRGFRTPPHLATGPSNRHPEGPELQPSPSRRRRIGARRPQIDFPEQMYGGVEMLEIFHI